MTRRRFSRTWFCTGCERRHSLTVDIEHPTEKWCGVAMRRAARPEKLTVKVGLTTLNETMTRDQALRYGKRHMPADLKRAGFQVTVARSDREMHGGEWFRINYGK